MMRLCSVRKLAQMSWQSRVVGIFSTSAILATCGAGSVGLFVECAACFRGIRICQFYWLHRQCVQLALWLLSCAGRELENLRVLLVNTRLTVHRLQVCAEWTGH